MKISGDNINIEDVIYAGTPVHWELITSKTPDDSIYTSGDIDNYKDILIHTNAVINPQTGKVKASSSNQTDL